MYCLESMSPCDLVILALLLALAVCDNQDANTLNVLGNFIVAVGSLVLIWAAQKEYLDSRKESNRTACC
jgi:hypothetical protein